METGDLGRWEADVILSDGGTVHVRPIRPDDGTRILALHERLSKESKYLRFFSPMPNLAPSLLDRFVNVDYVDRFALVALLGAEIIGVARYDALEADRSQAEVAFTVDDAHQGRGVASVLLEHLAAVAQDRGLTRFLADTLPNNSKMLGVFRAAGYADDRHFADGVVRVSFPIQPTPASLDVVHERERHAAAASVGRLLKPRSVAVIGAGRTPNTIGHEVFRNILRSGFTGPVYPVNTEATSVASVRAYPSLAAIGAPVDLAVVVVPAADVPAVVAECGAPGVSRLVVMSSGFADAGPAGALAQRALVDDARAHGMRLLGPSSMGVANADGEFRLNATLAAMIPPPGRVAFMSQSGTLGVAIFEEARRRRIGVSSFVSAGNKSDVSGNDVIQYWDEDPGTDVVLLYLESFGNPRTFARVARRLSRHKAIVAVKGGRAASGRLVAGTPWAVAAGSDEIVDALFRHTGVIRVDTLAQLFDVADVLAHQPLPAGRRVGIVANEGGAGVLAADACEDAGLVVPRLSESTQDALRVLLEGRGAVANPVTVSGTATADAYEGAVSLVLADHAIDALIVAFLHPLATPPAEVAAAVLRADARQEEANRKPLLANFMAADDALAVFGNAPATVPVFPFPEAAAQALARVVSLREWRNRPEGRTPAFDDIDHEAARMIVDTVLDEQPDGADLDLATAIDLLTSYGIAVAPTCAVTNLADAVTAARGLGYPVALKAAFDSAESRVTCRSLASDGDLAEAWAQLTAASDEPSETGSAPERALVVQAMMPAGIDTVIEVEVHPSFGPVLAFGTGGPAAEIYGDRVLRVLPLTDVDADEMLREVRGAPLLQGWRHSPPVDLAALSILLQRVSRLSADLPEVTSLVLDPVIAGPSGAVSVGARVTVAPYQARPELALRRLH